jgi:hypothetical protein
MKPIKFLFISTVLFISFSCDKEYSTDAYNISPFAQGTLKDSTGDCIHDSAIGNYYYGIMPNPDSNYVELKMHVVQAGNFRISTDAQNGLRFADSGYVFNTGDTLLHLKPIGVPLMQETTFFTVSFNNDVCYFYVHVQ